MKKHFDVTQGPKGSWIVIKLDKVGSRFKTGEIVETFDNYVDAMFYCAEANAEWAGVI